MRIRVALLVAVLAVAVGAPGAPASSPGRTGAIVYDDANSSFDPLNKGATRYTESLSALSPALRAERAPVPGQRHATLYTATITARTHGASAPRAARNYCSSDGDLGGDVIEGIGWQPLSRAGR
ncbi:MAG: hypothetical protein M3022_07260 [Actinomycetota bacterium]|nr:hypothetical protein [Actinomycetota bacterium]